MPRASVARVAPEGEAEHAALPAPSGAGILKLDAKRSGRVAPSGSRRSVRWRTVLVADAERTVGPNAVAEELTQKNPCLALALLLRDLRLWLLTYEVVMIPIRFSLTDVVVGSAACTALDILVDLCEVLLNETMAVRANLPLLTASQSGRPLPVGTNEDEARAAPYSTRRMLLDILTIALLHCGRAVYFLFGRRELFAYAQIVRTTRVLDLSAHVHALNSDLATNVRFLSIFKFSLVLLSVPHWCACLWIVVADGWGNGAAQVLPSWPAQFELFTSNPGLDPNVMSSGERYLVASFMSYAGLAAFGYSVRARARALTGRRWRAMRTRASGLPRALRTGAARARGSPRPPRPAGRARPPSPRT